MLPDVEALVSLEPEELGGVLMEFLNELDANASTRLHRTPSSRKRHERSAVSR
jgi:hypothetical protein